MKWNGLEINGCDNHKVIRALASGVMVNRDHDGVRQLTICDSTNIRSFHATISTLKMTDANRKARRDDARKTQHNKQQKIQSRAANKRRLDRMDAQEINRAKLRHKLGIPDDPSKREIVLRDVQKILAIMYQRPLPWLASLVVAIVSIILFLRWCLSGAV